MFSVRTDRDGELDIALRVSVQDVNTAVQLVLPCTILMFGAGITLSALSFVGQAWCSDAHPKGQKVLRELLHKQLYPQQRAPCDSCGESHVL